MVFCHQVHHILKPITDKSLLTTSNSSHSLFVISRLDAIFLKKLFPDKQQQCVQSDFFDSRSIQPQKASLSGFFYSLRYEILPYRLKTSGRSFYSHHGAFVYTTQMEKRLPHT